MSNWNPLATLQLTENWQYTAITTDNVFKFAFTDSFNIASIAIAQAQISNSIELFDIRRLAVRAENEILTIEKPPFFDERRIAIRAIAFSDKKPPSLNVTLESLYMQLQNPPSISIEIPPFKKPLLSNVSPIELSGFTLIQPDPNRKGLILVNIGQTSVNVVLGEAEEGDFSFTLAPGGSFNVMEPYVGAIALISSAATTVMFTAFFEDEG